MAGKTERFIAPVYIEEQIPFHDMRAMKEIGSPRTYMDKSLVPEADIRIGVGQVKEVPPDGFKPHIEPHKHKVSQVYAIVGDLTVEVTLDGEKHEVTGPAGIFIPAGMTHCFRLLRGSGYTVVVLRDGKYEATQ